MVNIHIAESNFHCLIKDRILDTSWNSNQNFGQVFWKKTGILIKSLERNRNFLPEFERKPESWLIFLEWNQNFLQVFERKPESWLSLGKETRIFFKFSKESQNLDQVLEENQNLGQLYWINFYGQASQSVFQKHLHFWTIHL